MFDAALFSVPIFSLSCLVLSCVCVCVWYMLWLSCPPFLYTSPASLYPVFTYLPRLIIDTLKGLKIIHLNIGSLLPKIDLIRVWVTQYKPDILTFSETWLHSKISNNKIKLDNYMLYRANRGTRGGGVAIYVSLHLISEIATPKVLPSFFECLFVEVKLHENKHLIIGSIYRPPPVHPDSAKCILSTLTSFEHPHEMIILGDFNCNWLDRSSSNDKNLLKSIHLTQLINEPTRVDTRSKSLLDWILVTHSHRINKSGVLSDCFSDHSTIFCVWKIKSPRLPPKCIKVRQSKNINFDNFIHDLIAINWNRFQIIPYFEDAWNYFYSELTHVIDKHAPWKEIKVKGQHLPWISSDLINLFKQRDKAWKSYRETKDTADWEKYRPLRNLCKTKTGNAKSDFYENQLSENMHNPKQFWKNMNNILNKSNKSISTQLRFNNNIIQDPLVISNIFNHHFTSVSSSYVFDPTCVSSINSSSNSSFSFRKILPVEVQCVINELKVDCGPGPEGIETKFIKLAANILMYPLCDLFNLSLSTCALHSAWKCDIVTPLHKGGDPHDINNYRPISFINSIAKIFEKIIFNQLSRYILDYNILSPCQSGFRPSFSTATALTLLTITYYLINFIPLVFLNIVYFGSTHIFIIDDSV